MELDWQLTDPSSMTWEQRRSAMRNGSFEGSAEAERIERDLIRNHFGRNKSERPENE